MPNGRRGRGRGKKAATAAATAAATVLQGAESAARSEDAAEPAAEPAVAVAVAVAAEPAVAALESRSNSTFPVRLVESESESESKVAEVAEVAEVIASAEAPAEALDPVELAESEPLNQYPLYFTELFNAVSKLQALAIEEKWQEKASVSVESPDKADNEARVSIVGILKDIFSFCVNPDATDQLPELPAFTLGELKSAIQTLEEFLGQIHLKQTFGLKPLSETYSSNGFFNRGDAHKVPSTADPKKAYARGSVFVGSFYALKTKGFECSLKEIIEKASLLKRHLNSRAGILSISIQQDCNLSARDAMALAKRVNSLEEAIKANGEKLAAAGENLAATGQVLAAGLYGAQESDMTAESGAAAEAEDARSPSPSPSF